ncbi:MAG: GC-type dockerin domain-anchored protein, partial [Phycisphaerales bacterium]|nr:GC-type dockerin domain-anchored protein [Phycisphaerales bacterium]
VDLAGVTIGGNLQFDTTNAATVSLSAPVGATQVSFCNSGACMGMTLPAAAMAQGAALSVARIAPQDLLPAPALDPEGDPVGVQPLAGYAFDNDDLPLAGAGTIVIDLELPGMTPAGRAAVLAAVAQGSLTVAVQEDDPDSPWHARRVCTTGTPIPDECAVVQLLDANHVPTADPVLAQVVRLTCACTHFSTYAAAMVVPRCGTADLGSQGGSPGSDGLLDNNDFVVFIDYFFNADARADFGIQGGVPGHDALFDNNDFVVFIDAFFNGCP